MDLARQHSRLSNLRALAQELRGTLHECSGNLPSEVCGTPVLGGEGVEDGERVVGGAGKFDAEPLDGVGFGLNDVVPCFEELSDTVDSIGFRDEGDEEGKFCCCVGDINFCGGGRGWYVPSRLAIIMIAFEFEIQMWGLKVELSLWLGCYRNLASTSL